MTDWNEDVPLPVEGTAKHTETAAEKSSRRRVLYSAALVFVLMLAMFGLNAWYTNYIDEKNRRDWCELFTAITEQQRVAPAPPAGSAQERLQRLMERRRDSLDCDRD